MASVLVPVLYVIIVFGSLFVFSSFYRRRLASKGFEPYFPRHKDRDIYVSLLQRTDPPVPDQLLKAALIRRAMTDVHRIMRLREDKPALQNLLQKGSIGDDLWNSLLAAEKELEAEILEVAAEANSFVDGWGTVIFQTATEMIHNEKMRTTVEQIPTIRAEKELKYPVKPGSRSPQGTPGLLTPNTAATNSSFTSSMASSVGSTYTGTGYTGSSVTSSVPPTSPYPQTPLSSQSQVSQASSTNGLAPPPSAGAESAVSSEGEAPASSAPSTPRTPKSAKKARKRK